MASDHHNNHRQNRPHRLSLPPRTTTTITPTTPITPSRHYPPFTPTPTPSKHRRLPSFSATKSKKKISPSSLFLLLFSLRSLYSLLPFLQSSPSSFSVFPFSFLVSLLSFILSLCFSLFKQQTLTLTLKPKSIFAFHRSITILQQRILFAKSVLLAIVFLLRFQALRYCGTAAMILAEMAGYVASHFITGRNQNRSLIHLDRVGSNKVRGFFALFIGVFLLSISWDRIECFPFSFVNLSKLGFSSVLIPNSEKCVRVGPMLLPFLSGFLGGYEQGSINWGTIRDLGRKEVRLIALFYTTILLFIPAAISMLVFEAEGDSVSIGSLGWPLANTVVFGVLLSESYTDEKMISSKDFRKEFLVTFVCTLILELLYYPELSLWGLMICGMLLGVGVMELDPVNSNSLELGLESPDTFLVSISKIIRHILNERKSRKIALFLLINTGYMVVEFVAGFMNNSLGLISDACHMLFDCAALAIGLYASYIARLPANDKYTYGRGRFEVLSGYTNAVFLVLVGVLIVLESLERILEPQEISTSSLLTVSIGGLAVNVVGLIFFHDEHHHAHGGGASCSHSHSHHHSHVHGDNKLDSKHQDHENNSDHHKSHTSHFHDHGHDHDHHVHDHVSISSIGVPGEDKQKHHDHHHDHGHHHDHHNQHHDHHDHGQHHDHHDHGHHQDHHDHGHHQDHHHDHGQHHHHDHGQHQDHHHDHDHGQHHDHHHDHGQHHDHHLDHGKHHDHHHDHGQHQDHHHDHDHGQHHDHHHDHGQHHDHHLDHGKHHDHHHDHDHDHDHGHHHEKQKHHHHIDHNMEGIFLHVLADTLGSVGVVVSTLLIQYKGWLIADPACSIFISVLIVSSVIPLLRNSAEVLLQRVPRAHEHDLKAAVSSIMKIKGISGIQNFHIWSLANNDIIGTLHMYISSETDKISTKKQVSDILHNAGIKDLTLQVEYVGS